MITTKRFQIGVVDKPGTFSDRWIHKLEQSGCELIRINVWSNDVLEQLQNCDGLLWHIEHTSPKEKLIASHILYACKLLGVLTFPSLSTLWTFDDKVSQRYVLEAAGARTVPTYLFFEAESALAWVRDATFPKVFKLRCGAGSRNVRLVRSQSEAVAIVRRAFGKGFRSYGGNAADAVNKALSRRLTPTEVWSKLRRAPATLWKLRQLNHLAQRERGYVYFQDFVPDNAYDTRITVVGDRAFAYRRMVRPNDFRASGSGAINYDRQKIDVRCVEMAFQVAARLGSQSLGFDFVKTPDDEPRIVEVSYVYVPELVFRTGGYWTRELQWRGEAVWPQDAILDDFLAALDANSRVREV